MARAQRYEVAWDEAFDSEDSADDELQRTGVAALEERTAMPAEALSVSHQEAERKYKSRQMLSESTLFAYLRKQPPTIGPQLEHILAVQEGRGISEHSSYTDYCNALKYPPTRDFTRARERNLCSQVHGRGCSQCQSCHFCRQKTTEPKLRCYRCSSAPRIRNRGRAYWCGSCLWLRHGENADELSSQRWLCPCCRGICNCSASNCQRTLAKLEVTAQLTSEATGYGYQSVAHYLILATLDRHNATALTSEQRQEAAARQGTRRLAQSGAGAVQAPNRTVRAAARPLERAAVEQVLRELPLPAHINTDFMQDCLVESLLEKDDWLAGLGAPTPAASSTGPNSMGTGLGASGNPRSYSSALIGGVSGGGHGNGASGFGSAQSRIDEMVRSWQTGEPCASSSWQHHPAHPAAAAQGPHAAQGQEGAEESAPVPRAAGSEGMGLQAGPSISAGTGAISGSGLYGRDNGFEVMQYLAIWDPHPDIPRQQLRTYAARAAAGPRTGMAPRQRAVVNKRTYAQHAADADATGRPRTGPGGSKAGAQDGAIHGQYGTFGGAGFSDLPAALREAQAASVHVRAPKRQARQGPWHVPAVGPPQQDADMQHAQAMGPWTAGGDGTGQGLDLRASGGAVGLGGAAGGTARTSAEGWQAGSGTGGGRATAGAAPGLAAAMSGDRSVGGDGGGGDPEGDDQPLIDVAPEHDSSGPCMELLEGARASVTDYLQLLYAAPGEANMSAAEHGVELGSRRLCMHACLQLGVKELEHLVQHSFVITDTPSPQASSPTEAERPPWLSSMRELNASLELCLLAVEHCAPTAADIAAAAEQGHGGLGPGVLGVSTKALQDVYESACWRLVNLEPLLDVERSSEGAIAAQMRCVLHLMEHTHARMVSLKAHAAQLAWARTSAAAAARRPDAGPTAAESKLASEASQTNGLLKRCLERFQRVAQECIDRMRSLKSVNPTRHIQVGGLSLAPACTHAEFEAMEVALRAGLRCALELLTSVLTNTWEVLKRMLVVDVGMMDMLGDLVQLLMTMVGSPTTHAEDLTVAPVMVGTTGMGMTAMEAMVQRAGVQQQQRPAYIARPSSSATSSANGRSGSGGGPAQTPAAVAGAVDMEEPAAAAAQSTYLPMRQRRHAVLLLTELLTFAMAKCPNASALQSHADEMLPLIDAHVADIYPDRLGQGQQVAAGVALVRNDLRSATSQLTDKIGGSAVTALAATLAYRLLVGKMYWKDVEACICKPSTAASLWTSAAPHQRRVLALYLYGLVIKHVHTAGGADKIQMWPVNAVHTFGIIPTWLRALLHPGPRHNLKLLTEHMLQCVPVAQFFGEDCGALGPGCSADELPACIAQQLLADASGTYRARLVGHMLTHVASTEPRTLALLLVGMDQVWKINTSFLQGGGRDDMMVYRMQQVRAMACCVSTMVVTTAQQLMDANVRASAQLANLGVVLPELCFRLCQTLPGGVCAAYALQNHCKRQAEGMTAEEALATYGAECDPATAFSDVLKASPSSSACGVLQALLFTAQVPWPNNVAGAGMAGPAGSESMGTLLRLVRGLNATAVPTCFQQCMRLVVVAGVELPLILPQKSQTNQPAGPAKEAAAGAADPAAPHPAAGEGGRLVQPNSTGDLVPAGDQRAVIWKQLADGFDRLLQSQVATTTPSSGTTHAACLLQHVASQLYTMYVRPLCGDRSTPTNNCHTRHAVNAVYFLGYLLKMQAAVKQPEVAARLLPCVLHITAGMLQSRPTPLVNFMNKGPSLQLYTAMQKVWTCAVLPLLLVHNEHLADACPVSEVALVPTNAPGYLMHLGQVPWKVLVKGLVRAGHSLAWEAHTCLAGYLLEQVRVPRAEVQQVLQAAMQRSPQARLAPCLEQQAEVAQAHVQRYGLHMDIVTRLVGATPVNIPNGLGCSDLLCGPGMLVPGSAAQTLHDIKAEADAGDALLLYMALVLKVQGRLLHYAPQWLADAAASGLRPLQTLLLFMAQRNSLSKDMGSATTVLSTVVKTYVGRALHQPAMQQLLEFSHPVNGRPSVSGLGADYISLVGEVRQSRARSLALEQAVAAAAAARALQVQREQQQAGQAVRQLSVQQQAVAPAPPPMQAQRQQQQQQQAMGATQATAPFPSPHTGARHMQVQPRAAPAHAPHAQEAVPAGPTSATAVAAAPGRPSAPAAAPAAAVAPRPARQPPPPSPALTAQRQPTPPPPLCVAGPASLPGPAPQANQVHARRPAELPGPHAAETQRAQRPAQTAAGHVQGSSRSNSIPAGRLAGRPSSATAGGQDFPGYRTSPSPSPYVMAPQPSQSQQQVLQALEPNRQTARPSGSSMSVQQLYELVLVKLKQRAAAGARLEGRDPRGPPQSDTASPHTAQAQNAQSQEQQAAQGTRPPTVNLSVNVRGSIVRVNRFQEDSNLYIKGIKHSQDVSACSDAYTLILELGKLSLQDRCGVQGDAVKGTIQITGSVRCAAERDDTGPAVRYRVHATCNPDTQLQVWMPHTSVAPPAGQGAALRAGRQHAGRDAGTSASAGVHINTSQEGAGAGTLGTQASIV